MRRLTSLLLCLALVACEAESEPTSTATSPPDTTVAPSSTSTTAGTVPPQTVTTAAPTSTSTVALDDTVLAYQEVANLEFPVQLTARPGEQSSYVATKDGAVWLFDGSVVAEEPVLDIREQVRNRGEQGLLSIAFAPDYADSGLFYVDYTNRDGDTRVVEYRAEDGKVDRDAVRLLDEAEALREADARGRGVHADDRGRPHGPTEHRGRQSHRAEAGDEQPVESADLTPEQALVGRAEAA